MNGIAIATIVLAIITALGLMISLFFNFKIKKISMYWVISLIGAIIIVLININDAGAIFSSLISDSAINPIKILTFFLCMTILSIVLDNLNFFNYLATKCVKLAKNSQFKLFIIFYALVSFLTVFTSNDIVILAFVPFICYFCKNANINPLPYVFSTFVAANTWSMLFVIGNPTNVYIASFAGIDFVTYFLQMAIPTIVCGVASLLVLLLLFRKKLKEKISIPPQQEVVINKPLVIMNAFFLLACTICLAISSYIGFEMWYIALGFVVVEIFANLLFCLVKKQDKSYILNSVKRAPWAFVPFLLSMFLIIMCLDVNGVTTAIASVFSNDLPLLTYGVSSFFCSNLINNIPMTALFASILGQIALNPTLAYATIIGSNLGALLSPVGALAGIMFLNILKEKNIKFSIKDFIKYGIVVSIISLALALFMLWLI